MLELLLRSIRCRDIYQRMVCPIMRGRKGYLENTGASPASPLPPSFPLSLGCLHASAFVSLLPNLKLLSALSLTISKSLCKPFKAITSPTFHYGHHRFPSDLAATRSTSAQPTAWCEGHTRSCELLCHHLGIAALMSTNTAEEARIPRSLEGGHEAK